MNNEHVIADEVLDLIALAISKGETWMAYNNTLYFLDKGDVCFFKDKEAALVFSESNYSDQDRFQIIHIQSVADVYRQLPYGGRLENEISNPDANGLHNHEGNAFTDSLIEHIEQQQIINNFKMNVMNEQNFQYLKDNIKYMGFGENLGDVLAGQLQQGKPEFTLSNKIDINKKAFEVSLHFRKPENSDMYFFNSYDASLTKANGEKVDQRFYLNKGKGITAKEAYNLLEGRAVFKEMNTKEGQAYSAWVQLDFHNKDKHNNHVVKQFHENYGFDLKAAVGKFALAELADPEKERTLLQSLQKGNIQSVSVEKDGNSSKVFIEANPQYKTINLYDGQMKRLQKEELSQYHSVQQSPGKEMKTEQKEEQAQDKKKEVKQQVGKEPGKPVNKNSRKKGLSV
ncbi:hypothetical protein [Terrimonas alba]|uniref:hypothetical protein n=1 Tax=Terrimonas alba TaxID=3349636 RepID=UPI0035F33B98